MAKPKVLLGVALHHEAQAKLEQRFEIVKDEAQLSGCAAALVYSPGEDWPERLDAQGLRAIACHAYWDKVGAWAPKQGIQLTDSPSLWRTVAEHTLALMMAAARNIPAADAAIREKKWKDHENLKGRYSGFDFQGRTLGILGMGQIGTELAGLVSGFKMQVLYYDLEDKKIPGAKWVSLEEVLKKSDFISVLLPVTPETTNILGEEEFAKIGPGAVFVNTARAAIISEAGFLRAVREGRIAAAGLDVYWDEPLPKDHPLMDMPNVILNPHLGGSTRECDMGMVDALLKAEL